MGLVHLARDGDKAAFAKLVEQYQNRIVAVAYGVAGNRQDAEDIAQDTFIKAYKGINSLQEDGVFYRWLVRIAVNTAISHKQSGRSGELIPLESIAEPVDQGETPEAYLERRGEEERIQEMLAPLPSDSRAVLVLREIEGLGYEEIAKVLEIPIGTVRSRIHYARDRLRRAISLKNEVK
ncbi:MAG TPA: sigma-70 family RNA polymerase sigma factor [Selenomonadales bacterium]|nr:sigma-70 family RNA polymerase sigma factor [Selenomonadales bacterium]